MPTAIMVDGKFYLKRYRNLYPNPSDYTAAKAAKNLHEICLKHLLQKDNPGTPRELYRIFFYDCPPVQLQVKHPISKNTINYSDNKEFHFRANFHYELMRLRKVVLRFGKLYETGYWQIKPSKAKELLENRISIEHLNENDILYSLQPSGVDLKIGLDTAYLALKKQVDQIILIANGSDFVPAAKLARREGIDFILDPMWSPISDELYEHIDGLRSTCISPKKENHMIYESPESY